MEQGLLQKYGMQARRASLCSYYLAPGRLRQTRVASHAWREGEERVKKKGGRSMSRFEESIGVDETGNGKHWAQPTCWTV